MSIASYTVVWTTCQAPPRFNNCDANFGAEHLGVAANDPSLNLPPPTGPAGFVKLWSDIAQANLNQLKSATSANIQGRILARPPDKFIQPPDLYSWLGSAWPTPIEQALFWLIGDPQFSPIGGALPFKVISSPPRFDFKSGKWQS